jgi:hypothetical protein
MSILEFSPPAETEVYLIDLDSAQYDPFAVLPQVRCVARTEAQALAVINHLVNVVNNDRDMTNAVKRYLFIDEFQMLSIEADESDQIVDLMEVLAKRGRKHGVPWFVGTQDPTGQNYPRALQKNTKVTLAGYTQDDSYLVDPIGVTGASKLRGDGDFIFKAAGAQKNFKGFLVTDNDVKAFVEAMRNKWGTDTTVIQFEEQPTIPDQQPAFTDGRPSALPLPVIDRLPKVARDAAKVRPCLGEAYDTEAAALRSGWGKRLASILYDKDVDFAGNYRNRVMAAVDYALTNEPNERTERTNKSA